MEPEILLENQNEKNLAIFSARVVAFSVDLALAAAGCLISLKLCFPSYSPFLNPHSGQWAWLWTAIFLAYHAYASSGGRRSIGKALVGLRILDLQGAPLSLGKAALRSAAYLVSSIFNLGFLWAIFNPINQGWHDLAAGSLVIDEKPQSSGRLSALRAGACACLALIGGLWYWNTVLAARYERLQDVAYAHAGLEELKKLQQLYFYSHGRFADNLTALAQQSGTPNLFMEDMEALFDPQAGIQITASPKRYRIVARATDDDKTLIAFNGP